MDNRDCYIMINPMKIINYESYYRNQLFFIMIDIINKEYLLQHKRVTVN